RDVDGALAGLAVHEDADVGRIDRHDRRAVVALDPDVDLDRIPRRLRRGRDRVVGVGGRWARAAGQTREGEQTAGGGDEDRSVTAHVLGPQQGTTRPPDPTGVAATLPARRRAGQDPSVPAPMVPGSGAPKGTPAPTRCLMKTLWRGICHEPGG